MTFRPDLLPRHAVACARHRPSHPVPLINHIIRTAVVSPPGKFLDLACGPGTLAIPLHQHFAESWAVDLEPDILAIARTKVRGIRFIESAAEDLSPPPATFDLITIGNAFHRMAPRRGGGPHARGALGASPAAPPRTPPLVPMRSS